ncbi:hypothetical protein GEMRC1_010681 [Eukaryota sp. GEM-RC1]
MNQSSNEGESDIVDLAEVQEDTRFERSRVQPRSWYFKYFTKSTTGLIFCIDPSCSKSSEPYAKTTKRASLCDESVKTLVSLKAWQKHFHVEVDDLLGL